MAIVSKLEKISIEKNSPHCTADCTYSIVTDDEGIKYLQIDSYGSASRKFKGKKSQSLRFGPQAIKQLKRIIESEF
jgi:hypothetical protein